MHIKYIICRQTCYDYDLKYMYIIRNIVIICDKIKGTKCLFKMLLMIINIIVVLYKHFVFVNIMIQVVIITIIIITVLILLLL